MVDPTTVNTSLAIPIRGTDVGTWDLPVNGNFVTIDNMFGGVTTIILTNANVTLLSSQAQASIVRLTGTLTGNVNIVMTSIFKGLRFDNQLLNSLSSFAAFAATAASSYIVGIPPGTNDLYYDGTKVDYANLGRVGEYWDCATATVPSWVASSTKPPYLLCNGQTFSSATYPVLANTLGSTTTPDARGRVRMMSNLGTNRVTIFNGDTLFLGGGDQQVQAHAHTGSGTTSDVSADHTHTGSGTTATESALHTHTGSGNTGFVSADHTHHMDFMSGNADRSLDHLHSGNPSPVNIIGDGINAFSAWSYYQAGGGFTGPMDRSIDHLHHIVGDTGGISANHFHSYSFTTATESVGHTHTYSFTTSGESNGHTHTFSFTSSTFGSGASLNMQPTFVGGITMIRAA